MDLNDPPSDRARTGSRKLTSVLTGFLYSEIAVLLAAFSAVILYTAGNEWVEEASGPWIASSLFTYVFAITVWAAFAAVRHADSLAERLGEPYGTLILTLSVVCIEVSVIMSVMLTGPFDPNVPRDTMLAIVMLVLNGMVGTCLMIGGLRYGEQEFNLQGARSYLAVLMTLATITLILPRFTTSTSDPSLTPAQSLLFSAATIVLYCTFLIIQTYRHRGFFMEPEIENSIPSPQHGKHPAGLETNSISYHAVMLVVTLIAIVLLAEKLGGLVEDVIALLDAPRALSGVVIAVLVLAPEGLTAFVAASQNHLQRAVNICLGSALATISLTVPTVVVVCLFTEAHIVLGLGAAETVLLVLTLTLSILTFGSPRTNMLLGMTHLVILFVFLVLIFNP